jgi:antitoxin VapB
MKADGGGTGRGSRRAKPFWSGRSQAVRLPAEFRFEGDEVAVRREGDAVILEPVKQGGWPEGYWERIDELRGEMELGEIEPLG